MPIKQTTALRYIANVFLIILGGAFILLVYAVNGSFFFGSCTYIKAFLKSWHYQLNTLEILRDSSADELLKDYRKIIREIVIYHIQITK